MSASAPPPQAAFLAELARCETWPAARGLRPVLTPGVETLVLRRIRRRDLADHEVLERVPVLEEQQLWEVLPSDESVVPVVARTPYFLRHEGVRDILEPGRLVGVAWCGGTGSGSWYTALSVQRWGGIFPDRDVIADFRSAGASG